MSVAQHNGQSNGPVATVATSASVTTTTPLYSISTSSEVQQQVENLPQPSQPPLSDFLLQLEEYTPTIPDAVTKYYLSTAGFETSDARVLRLVSLAAQKFVSDVANDALQHCKMRGAAQTTKNKSKDRKYVLSTDDISLALSDQGIVLKKPPYFI